MTHGERLECDRKPDLDQIPTAPVERALFHCARSTTSGSYLAALTLFSTDSSIRSTPPLPAPSTRYLAHLWLAVV